MRILVVLGLVLACTSLARVADAQSATPGDARMAQAKKAFQRGTRAYSVGDFQTALTSFERAYELTGSPDLLYNIATVSDRMRLDEEALKAYQGYLRARPESADREHVESRIGVLQTSLEERRRQEIEAEIEARQAAVEAVARMKAERPLTEYVGPGPGPWITIGVGGASLITGAVLFGLGQRDQNKVENAEPGSSFSSVEEMADRGPKRTKAGIALMAIGGAGVLGGAIWQLIGGREETVPEVRVGPGRILVKGSF